MAKLIYKEFAGVGKGFEVATSIPPAGLVSVLRAARQGERNKFRYSLDNGQTFTDWLELDDANGALLGKLTDRVDLVMHVVTEPFYVKKRLARMANTVASPFDLPASSIFYDRSIFKTFFESNDTRVLGWALNVLEKLFEPNVIPLYISRNNQDDYNAFFLTITHFFAFIVIYGRQFREIENSDILLKKFVEGWGIVYENIDTPEQRAFLFQNWINQFYERGTRDIAAKEELNPDGSIKRLNGELRRLVGYQKPNEFIFAVLTPQDIGWCLGYSSPTWYGTETVNAVSKGYDFGMVYSEPEKGVGELANYPTIGTLERKQLDDINVFQLTGSGRVGLSTEADPTKALEVYPGLDYEISIWVKALNAGAQNLEFGVHCYDGNMQLINQARITDLQETNSFYTGDRYQSPCKVAGQYYRLTGIIYNILAQRSEDFYLNFENGRPLRFMGDVKYMAPYLVQNRDGNTADVVIAGVTLKPLYLHVDYELIENRQETQELPYPAMEYSFTKDGKFTVLRSSPTLQGYLGQPNAIAMYAQIKSARTKQDIEEFTNRYLVSYKNVVSYTWLDWVVRTSWFLTFYVKKELDGSPIAGAIVTLDNGFTSTTDADGYVRFELQDGSVVNWTVTARGATATGSATMNKDQVVNVLLNVPLEVDVTIVEAGWGTVNVEGSKLPNTKITLTATPTAGYVFIKYVINPGATELTTPIADYWLTTFDINVQAIFERSGELSFAPAEVTIPAEGGTATVTATSTKHWQFDTLPEDWATVTPNEGNEGDTTITIKIE